MSFISDKKNNINTCTDIHVGLPIVINNKKICIVSFYLKDLQPNEIYLSLDQIQIPT